MSLLYRSDVTSRAGRRRNKKCEGNRRAQQKQNNAIAKTRVRSYPIQGTCDGTKTATCASAPSVCSRTSSHQHDYCHMLMRAWPYGSLQCDEDRIPIPPGSATCSLRPMLLSPLAVFQYYFAAQATMGCFMVLVVRCLRDINFRWVGGWVGKNLVNRDVRRHDITPLQLETRFGDKVT